MPPNQPTLVSVILLTKNGERYLDEVLHQIFSQTVGCRIEVIAVDSGSQDRTLDILKKFPVAVHRIPAEQFDHGETRNLGARLASGEFVVYLTQDATPADEHWLTSLITPLQTRPDIAAICSRQLPRSDCNPIQADYLGRILPIGGAAEKIKRWPPDGRLPIPPTDFIFLSNTSAAYRRSLLEQFPFPTSHFAEDAWWELQILQQGYATMFQPRSMVLHSHTYPLVEHLRNSYDAARAMRSIFAANETAEVTYRFLVWRTSQQLQKHWKYLRERRRALWWRTAWMVYALIWYGVKGIGRALGRNHDRLPTVLQRRLSRQLRIMHGRDYRVPAITTTHDSRVRRELPRRILLLVEATLGGVRRHILDLALGLSAHGWEVTLGYAHGRADALLTPGLAALGSRVKTIELPLVRAVAPINDLIALTHISRIIRAIQPSVVHTHSAKAGFLGRLTARLQRVPVVVHTPNAWSFLATERTWGRHLYKVLERRAARWTDAIICVSREERRLAITNRIANEHKLFHIPNGIALDGQSVNRAAARAQLKLSQTTVAIGSVTRFAPQKDPLGTVTALAPLLKTTPTAQLLLIGDGPLRPTVEAYIREHSLTNQVRCLGFYSDIPTLNAAFDVFLLPSRYEGLAYAVLEAMAAGLPVVTTAGGNEDAVLHGENGLVVTFGDADALRTAVKTLLDDPTLRHQMGQASKKLVARFEVGRMVSETEALYLRLAKQKGIVLT